MTGNPEKVLNTYVRTRRKCGADARRRPVLPEALVLYRMRPPSKCAGRHRCWGARPIQLLEGSRPVGTVYAYSMVLGLGERLREQVLELEESESRMGSVVVCPWQERDFEPRLETESWFGGRTGAPRRQVVRDTE
jgi:hypothetical protein